MAGKMPKKKVKYLVLVVCFLLLFSLSGCEQTQDVSEHEVTETDRQRTADITHDGIKDVLELKMDQVENPQSDEEPTVLLKSGATGKTVWGLPVNTVHAGWKGVYLYKEKDKQYLMVFSPAMSQGLANYEYSIFYVDEAGKEHVLHSNQFQFDINHPKETDPASLRSFTKEINQYLSKAELILSTLEGELKTAADDKEEPVLTYDPSETLREMETALEK